MRKLGFWVLILGMTLFLTGGCGGGSGDDAPDTSAAVDLTATSSFVKGGDAADQLMLSATSIDPDLLEVAANLTDDTDSTGLLSSARVTIAFSSQGSNLEKAATSDNAAILGTPISEMDPDQAYYLMGNSNGNWKVLSKLKGTEGEASLPLTVMDGSSLDLASDDSSKIDVELSVVTLPSTAETLESQLTISTGGVYGIYYPVAQGIAGLVNASGFDGNVSVVSGFGSVNNCKLIRDGKVEMAITQSDAAYYAVKGESPFDSSISNLKGIATLYPEAFQIVVTSADIGSIASLDQRKIYAGSATSLLSQETDAILDANDVNAEFVYSLPSDKKVHEALEDGDIDAYVLCSGFPNAWIEENLDEEEHAGWHVLSFTDDQVEKAIGVNPFLKGVSIDAGTYDGQDSDLFVPAIWAILAVDGNIDNDTVEKFTETFWNNIGSLGQYVQGNERSETMAAYIDSDTAQDAFSDDTVPLHPGAASYYDSNQ